MYLADNDNSSPKERHAVQLSLSIAIRPDFVDPP